MTGSAVGELGALLLQEGSDCRIICRIIRQIIFGAIPMTGKAPTHVQHLRVFIDFHLAHVSMTGLTV
jgi:hypothetical protein